MGLLFQVILINLLVSCDNVGVIAMATRGLPKASASLARKVGIALSVALKFVFLFAAGSLLGVSWLHIRILGGVMLIYATWSMLRETAHSGPKGKGSSSSFLFALLSIVAADISMSLDNVVAVLGIITSEGSFGARELLIALAGIAACAPILVFFSEAIASLMEKRKELAYVCGGYLTYIAIMMIFEDETVRLFLKEINFVFTTPAAIIFGVFLAGYGALSEKLPKAMPKAGLLPLMLVDIAYSCMTVGVFSYLGTAPLIEGWEVTAEFLFGFPASGANSVYLLGSTSGILALCGARVSELAAREKLPYMDCLAKGFGGMLALIFLRLAVCFIGMSFSFGMGSIPLQALITSFAAQVLLLLAYSSIFCMVHSICKSRALGAAACMLFALAETAIGEMAMQSNPWSLAAVFFPSCQLEYIYERTIEGRSLLYPMVLSILYIITSTFIGLHLGGKIDRNKTLARDLIIPKVFKRRQALSRVSAGKRR
jgi:YjbE family integral membrane protein